MNPPWRYRVLVRLLSPLLAGYTLWRACKDGGSRYWWQRMGVFSLPRNQAVISLDDVQLWVHAASVGEVLTVLPLVKAWQARTGEKVLFTTGTPTGAAVLEKQAIDGIRHQYLPVDFPGACQRFINQLPVRTGWIVETEIWPWLYATCDRAGIALTIINGRLSRRTSTQSKGLLSSSYRRALSSVRVLARSQQDVDNFIALGTPPSRVELLGNLKYTDAPGQAASHSPLERDYVLAASTHDDEELQLAGLWLQLAANNDLLVIVPRHPERGPAIMRELTALGAKVSLRSDNQLPAAGEKIYLADTLGEMQAWYQFARACFVGGSLITRGGHNMLEPARYACPVIVGPHTENFEDIMPLLLQSDGIKVAQTSDDVIRFLVGAFQDRADYAMMASRAQQVALDSQNVLQRYVAALS